MTDERTLNNGAAGLPSGKPVAAPHHRSVAPQHLAERQRLIPVDHPDRSSAFRSKARRPTLLAVEYGQDLPLVATDDLGRELARFRHLAHMAHFLNEDPAIAPTLPFAIVIQARGEDGEQLALKLEAA